jgi:hypothetical protein
MPVQRLRVWVLVLVAVLLPASGVCPCTAEWIPEASSGSDSAFVPAWILPGAPIRLVREGTADSTRGPARLHEHRHGRFLASTKDSLWLQDARSAERIVFDRRELRQVEVALGSHRSTARGALIGGCVAVLGGGLGMIMSSRSDDYMFAVAGLLIAPFIGASIGSSHQVDEWEVAWTCEGAR